jgi:pantoate--beta-alanine ligase
MNVIRTRKAVQAWRASLSAQVDVALVPTMGFLHDGHLSLIAEGRRRCQHRGPVVVTIFVNPTQFGPNEDFSTYPRDEAGDLAKCERAGADLVFAPEDPRELYLPDASTWINVENLDRDLCGASRPGHFRGVCTVVAKLWHLILPRWGIFGEKDFQQLAILRKMHSDLFFGGEIVGMPIVREPDGLAMSSRNAKLSATSRDDARAIFRFLCAVKDRFANGERDAQALVAGAEEFLAPGDIDYVRVVDAGLLSPIIGIVEGAVLVALAVRYGGVRLIDNMVLAP